MVILHHKTANIPEWFLVTVCKFSKEILIFKSGPLSVTFLGKIHDSIQPTDLFPKPTHKTETFPQGPYDPFNYKAESPDTFENVVQTNVYIS